MKLALASAAFLLPAVGVSHAAFLSDLNGPVSVDRGNGFRPVTQSTTVKAGTRVMASQNGSVVIQYPNNCQQLVEAGKVVVVVRDDQCVKLLQPSGSTAGATETGAADHAVLAGAAVGGAILLLSRSHPHSP